MNRKQNFIAIFAIALMALGTSLLFSCNADDEEYDFNGVYTMANGVKTRGIEGAPTDYINIFDKQIKLSNVMFVCQSLDDTLYVSEIQCLLTYSDITGDKYVKLKTYDPFDVKDVTITEYDIKKQVYNRFEVKTTFSAKSVWNDSVYTAKKTQNYHFQ